MKKSMIPTQPSTKLQPSQFCPNCASNNREKRSVLIIDGRKPANCTIYCSYCGDYIRSFVEGT